MSAVAHATPPVQLGLGTCEEQESKIGRPKGWTTSRLRKLARLYLFSKLPPKYIPEALQDGEWIPGYVSMFCLIYYADA